MHKKTDIIWVDEDFAKEYNKLTSDESKKAAWVEMFSEYVKTVNKASRDDFVASLDGLEEDVAIYKGLMLNVKQAFEKAKNEQLESSYELWLKFEEDMPIIKEKTQKIIDTLNPLCNKLTEMNDLMSKMNTYDFEKLISAIEKFAGLYGRNKDMVEFLFNNYKPDSEAN